MNMKILKEENVFCSGFPHNSLKLLLTSTLGRKSHYVNCEYGMQYDWQISVLVMNVLCMLTQ